ncbi:MAG: PIG-L deacetylase family protein [Gammaproteobacteria bacterium]
MLNLVLGSSQRAVRTLLCLGAHCDDIEIGCGGTVLRLAEHYPEMRVHWVVLSSSPVRADETRRSAERFLQKVGHYEIVIKEFRNSFFPFVGAQIKEFFEELKSQVSPDLVLTHTRHDLHQDHRLTCELTWNSFRNHLILEYEIPKYDGDLGAPNFFMPLEPYQYNAKIEYLLECFPSQRDKHWFTRETFLALMRLRGVESNAPSGYAEAFVCRKAVMSHSRITS